MTTKREYFIAALKAETFKLRHWVFSVFAQIDPASVGKVQPYPYQVRIADRQFQYRSPENLEEWLPISDGNISGPLITHKDEIQITNADAINVDKPIVTTYGILLFNYYALIYPFKTKLPYVEKVSISKIEEVIAARLEDDILAGNEIDTSKEDPSKIYIHEYLKYGEAMFFLRAFTQLWVPAATEKSLTYPKELIVLRDKRLEEYKDQLHDPAVVAKIEKELIDFYKENWIKGDPSEGFLLSGKSINIVRKKMVMMYGAEPGFGTGVEVNPITKSLAEGWDIERFPEMINALRSGSFNRGAETMLGGESVKWLLRSSSNMKVTQEDCGTDLGTQLTINEENVNNLIGRYVIRNKQSELITAETARSYVGKTEFIRSPQFCKLDKTDFCEHCVGQRLSIHKTGLSIAVSNYGSGFLYLFMGAMHGKQLATAKLDIETAFL